MAHMARLVMVVVVGLTRALLSHGWLTPRTSYPMSADGSSARVTAHFADVDNASTLLLSDDGTTLYVGARNAIVSLDVTKPGALSLKHKLDWAPPESDIEKCKMRSSEKDAPNCHNYIRVLQPLDATQLYTCGTHALKPHDTTIGTEMLTQVRSPAIAKGHCPYSAVERIAAVSVDGEMYVGTTSDYAGRTPSLSRFQSKGRVDVSLDSAAKSLVEPTFVKSSAIPGQEKVYFFFTETGHEFQFFNKLTVSRVAQVCKGDTGGELTLQKRWTTFAKAHLVCKQGDELPYNILQDIVHIPPLDQESSDDVTFYGVFSSQWSLASGMSALCAFKLSDIKEAFSGSYRTWSPEGYTKQTDKTQFGKCGLFKNESRRLEMVKNTFLTESSVQAVGNNMVLLSPDQAYSRVVGQQTRAADGTVYTVLFLLSESGHLHKVVLLDSGPHIIEAIQVFKTAQKVKNIVLSSSSGMVFVGSSEGVSRVPVSNCHFYKTCADCVMARDPFCAWDPTKAVCATLSTDGAIADVRQDVENGDTTKQCEGTVSQQGPQEKVLHLEVNRLTVLRCPKPSSQAHLSWRFSNGSQLPCSLYLQTDTMLVFVGTPLTVGRYHCVSTERGQEQTVAIFTVVQGVTPRTTGAAGNSCGAGAGGGGPTTVGKGPKTTATTKTTTNGAEGGKAVVTSGQRPGTSTGGTGSTGATPGNVRSTQEPDGYVITTQLEDVALRNAHKNTHTAKDGGDDPQATSEPQSFYSQLVVVSVLLALCLLMLGALYWWHRRSAHYAPSGTAQEKDPSLEKGEP
ncbi:semaphorin-4A [Engraulis encrasicolus]|uniref:semaphorin-4A n=1 Tax=Engraulis encrasicolus TaxID=184585 RepID=UPI002FCFC723